MRITSTGGHPAVLVMLLALSCPDSATAGGAAPVGQSYPVRPYAVTEERQPCSDFTLLRRPYFGDTHVHTAWSFDASSQDTRNKPPQAYAFARGERGSGRRDQASGSDPRPPRAGRGRAYEGRPR